MSEVSSSTWKLQDLMEGAPDLVGLNKYSAHGGQSQDRQDKADGPDQLLVASRGEGGLPGEPPS